MKIARLKFKDINALQGTWEIDFEQPPLADARLFAIVGPNGSGKTSILDAITLALYGETPRMKDLESTSLNSENGGAYAEVVFSVGGKSYRSQWSARKIDGKIEGPQMSIASLNGQETLLEERVAKVRTLVAELTGLDFKRFCRSILLAQGEFTAFLNALESERAEILEKIIGPEMTHELNESIHARARNEHEKLLQLKEAAESISTPSKDTVRLVEEALERLQEDLLETEGLMEELGRLEEWCRRLQVLMSEESSTSEELELAESRATKLRTDLDQRAVAVKAEPFRQDILRLNELQEEASQFGTLSREYEADIKLYQSRIEELESRSIINRQELEAARKRLEDRREDIDTAQQLDQDIETQEDRMEELTERHEALERLLGEKLQQQSELKRRIAEIESHQEELRSWLEKHGADADLGMDLAAIRNDIARLREVRDHLRIDQLQLEAAQKEEERSATMLKRAERSAHKVENKVKKLTVNQAARTRHLEELIGQDTLELLNEQYRRRKNRLAACRKLARMAEKYREQTRGEDIVHTLEQIKAQRDKLAEILSPEADRLAELEKKARWRESLKKYESDRLLLEPGKPCPLCGSMNHPFVKTGAPDFRTADQELEAQRTKVKALENELESFDTRTRKLEPQAKAAATIREEWTKTCAEAGAEWDIMSPESFDGELRSAAFEIKQLKSRIRVIRWRKWLEERGYRRLQRKTEKLSAKVLKRDQISEAHELNRKIVDNLQASLKDLREDEKREKEASESHIKKYGESFPKAGMELDLIERIQQRWAEYQRQVKEGGSRSERLSSLEIDNKALTSEIARLKEEAASDKKELEMALHRLSDLSEERRRLSDIQDPIQESQDLKDRIARGSQEESTLNQENEVSSRALSERQADLIHMSQQAEQAGAEAERVEQEILNQAISSGFNSIDEIRSALHFIDQAEVIEEQYRSAEEALAVARSRAETARLALESIRSERITEETIESISWKMTDAAKRRESLQEELEAARLLLQQYREAERQKRAAVQAVTEQEKNWARVIAQEEVLKSRDPAEARGKLHRLMLERLIENANQNLDELSGRYYLRPVSDEGFGLQVEDIVQGGARRSTKTLSGGESFIVSLCLALGLSEMASSDRKIESLFLDEGFGALDDEMLYRVIVALKTLRANGKMVGVISHVKRLADEIPTQIRIEKQPGGHSGIRIVA